tara:strand:+ start:3376 stop:3570 length:195 start_codon:yes stop_codon:yes gene_type:complete
MKIIIFISSLILGHNLIYKIEQNKKIEEYSNYYTKYPMSSCTYYDSLDGVYEDSINSLDTLYKK